MVFPCFLKLLSDLRFFFLTSSYEIHTDLLYYKKQLSLCGGETLCLPAGTPAGGCGFA